MVYCRVFVFFSLKKIFGLKAQQLNLKCEMEETLLKPLFFIIVPFRVVGHS